MPSKSFSTDWIATYHKPKGFVRPLELVPEDIYVEDIQHALSNLCRFNGHCREFYSVAQHSVHVSEWLSRNGYSLRTQFLGLIHDASEAYVGDMVRPLRRHSSMDAFNFACKDIQRKITNKLCAPFPGAPHRWWVDPEIKSPVKMADNDILSSECQQLFNITPDHWDLPSPKDFFHIKPISPRDAKILFEERFHELSVALMEG